MFIAFEASGPCALQRIVQIVSKHMHTYIHNLPFLYNGYTVVILSISSVIYKSGKIFNLEWQLLESN